MDDQLVFRKIFDNLNEGIYILNRTGDYIYCNLAFLKMTKAASREEVLTLNAFQLVPKKMVTVSVAVMAFEQKKKLSIVNNVVSPTGYRYRQMATATPIFDSVGEVEYMLVEVIRMDLFKWRYQQAVLNGDENSIEPILTLPQEEPKTVVAESAAMRALLSIAEQVAKVDTTVLITGETGTGKEVLANFIHEHSGRAERSMVEINCAALPENMLEAELFGYGKGAFTGALNTGKPGLVEKANGGTLFLDEINSLPLALQGKLLRVLETHKSKRLGEMTERDIDFRMLAATNQDLKAMVAEGTFRADLYYRLHVVPLEIPPLRQRRDDITPLALFFLDHFCQKYGWLKVFTKGALNQMTRYDWPGNVRELKNLVERLLVTSGGENLEIQHIADHLLNGDSEPEYMPAAAAAVVESAAGAAGDWKAMYQYDPEGFSLKKYMDSCEKGILSDVVKQCGSSYKAAEMLKTDQSTIVRKRHKYGI